MKLHSYVKNKLNSDSNTMYGGSHTQSQLEAFKLLIKVGYEQKRIFDIYKLIFKTFDDNCVYDESLCIKYNTTVYVKTIIYEGPLWTLHPINHGLRFTFIIKSIHYQSTDQNYV